MIFENERGWFFYADNRTFGPYSLRSGAESCAENYRAYFEDAPACHHEHSEQPEVIN